MMTTEDLMELLVPAKSALAASYARLIGVEYAKMVEVFGVNLRGVGNCWTHATTFRKMVAPCLAGCADGTTRLDTAMVLKFADAQADAAVKAWADKIVGKVEQLDTVERANLSGCSFTIAGQRDGRKVTIDQDVVLKRSPKGLLFNQFPARIYLDGKFTSEAAYKAAFEVADCAPGRRGAAAPSFR